MLRKMEDLSRRSPTLSDEAGWKMEERIREKEEWETFSYHASMQSCIHAPGLRVSYHTSIQSYIHTLGLKVSYHTSMQSCNHALG
ncbi:MAG TPA: hypothetical protein VMT35_13570 [Ignavibacteriaceae bacterium]|nr:hypothetical protein [Ignavibacteriaceae bacterium]